MQGEGFTAAVEFLHSERAYTFDVEYQHLQRKVALLL